MDKIFTFVVNEENKILLLLGSDKDPQYHKSFWYVVTGGCESYDESKEDTVKREVKEETNLDVKETMYLNWIFKYKSLGVQCTEYAYVSFVNSRKIILNEESIDYKWCNMKEFMDLIEWDGDKNELRNVLENAINRKVYFRETKIN